MRTLPLPVGSPKCLCRSCGLYWTSEAAFAAHRVGEYGINRRCLTQDELRAKGFAPNEGGYWRKPAPADAFKNRKAA